LLGLFAAAALLLSAIGVFGLFSFTVAQRTREMAVRAAIGARRTELITMVLGDALKLAAVGLAIGLAGAVAATRALEAQLYGVSALDPTTFAGVIALLAFTAVVASMLPALRAAAADPMTALRRE
jgi:ABC-type antimicrobial peptide transport system permease subunit